MARRRKETGAASVEHAALVLLMALVACTVVAMFSLGEGEDDSSLASAIAFKQRCAVRHPDPCWRDPLTEAYGRDLAGAIRALAPAPLPLRGPNGVALAPVDYRRCRQVSCASWAGPHLTASNRRTTAFTSAADLPAGGALVSYWSYRPTIGWDVTERTLDATEIAAQARTPLPEDADPVLVPLETTLGRDDARFAAGEEPPWRGEVESRWGR